eukprot:SAG31_NODE_17115_length_683_cov_0.720890_1_plen_36_part_10
MREAIVQLVGYWRVLVLTIENYLEARQQKVRGRRKV